jgi:hypothetical protein
MERLTMVGRELPYPAEIVPAEDGDGFAASDRLFARGRADHAIATLDLERAEDGGDVAGRSGRMSRASALLVLGLGSLAFILFAMVRAVVKERTDGRPIWHEFGLGIALMLLFFGTWVGHGIAQWQVFTDEQAAHNQPVEAGNFLAEFASATLENWQSEFLQLFAFVVLAALFLFKSSAESKDTDEKIEAAHGDPARRRPGREGRLAAA